MNTAQNTNQLLSISSPPFWHSGRTLKAVMMETCIALIPVIIMAFMTWGLDVLSVVGLSVATSVLTEALCQKVMGRRIAVDDFSAVLTGLLLAFMLPAAAPWWLVVLASAFSITMGKMAFGDLGASPLCAPVVGFIVCQVSFPIFFSAYAMQLTTEFIDPIFMFKGFGVEGIYDLSYQSLLMGEQINGLGSGQAGMLLLAGLYLCLRGIIAWEIPVAFVVGIYATAGTFNMFNPELYAHGTFHMLTGSTMLATFFLATDYSSSPNTRINMLVYGLFAGFLVILVRSFGTWYDGVPFAILLANLVMPLLEGNKRKPIITE